ncbi:hypothetical protein SAMN05421644_11040 [Allochromatium warmingii]|uniref:Uncharacterized protein n=1 Tax=Allochromatium warmingii TaxID=61595 RepID=A0A1H3DW98_ALLWA|nr:hypothetical protein [Allochromatium warmingii]SDX70675.1 hypothetical protein SAMN05421644_11040 [Allochromatium warmingii]
MANPDDYRFVVLDAVERLRRDAEAVNGADRYDQGRQMAYYEILQRILDSAETVGMTADEVGMQGFDPGALIGVRSNRAA